MASASCRIEQSATAHLDRRHWHLHWAGIGGVRHDGCDRGGRVCAACCGASCSGGWGLRWYLFVLLGIPLVLTLGALVVPGTLTSFEPLPPLSGTRWSTRGGMRLEARDEGVFERPSPVRGTSSASGSRPSAPASLRDGGRPSRTVCSPSHGASAIANPIRREEADPWWTRPCRGGAALPKAERYAPRLRQAGEGRRDAMGRSGRHSGSSSNSVGAPRGGADGRLGSRAI